METGTIYLITNKVTEKVYVGQTWHTIPFRWSRHLGSTRSGSTTPLHNSIRKHGPENFVLKPLATGVVTQEELDTFEDAWILAFNSISSAFGYNIKRGGSRGRHLEETRKKISELRLSEWQDPAMRDKRSQAIKLAWDNPHYRENMSEANIIRWENPEFREKMIKAFNEPQAIQNRRAAAVESWGGNTERKQSMSNTMLEKWEDPVYRQRRAEGMLEAQGKPEYKENCSVAALQRWQDENFREKRAEAMATVECKEKMSKGQLLVWAQPGYREKMSEKHKKRWSDPEFKNGPVGKKALENLSKRWPNRDTMQENVRKVFEAA